MRFDNWYLRQRLQREAFWRSARRTFDLGFGGWLALVALLVYGLVTL